MYFKLVFKKMNSNNIVTFTEEKNTIKVDKTKTLMEINESKKTINDLNINWEYINKISIRNIVWVKMPNYIKVNNSSNFHDERPYVVTNVNYSSKTYNGFYTTSNGNNSILTDKRYIKYKYVISCQKYKLANPSFVQFYRQVELPFKNVIFILDKLDTKDFNLMMKKVNLFKNKTVVSNDKNMVLESGDIIIDNNQLLLIFQCDYQFSYALEICKISINSYNQKDHPNYFKLNNIIYSIDFNNTIIINNIDEFIIIDIILEDTLKDILKKRNDYKLKWSHNNINSRKRKSKKKNKSN